MEVVKHTFKTSERLVPIYSIIVGMVVSGLAIFIPELQMDLSVPAQILAGAISGLMATGFYENIKQISDK